MNKPYLLGGVPASARDLIQEAKLLDEEFGSDGFFTTSEAASILRRGGYVVQENPDYPEDAK